MQVGQIYEHFIAPTRQRPTACHAAVCRLNICNSGEALRHESSSIKMLLKKMEQSHSASDVLSGLRENPSALMSAGPSME